MARRPFLPFVFALSQLQPSPRDCIRSRATTYAYNNNMYALSIPSPINGAVRTVSEDNTATQDSCGVRLFLCCRFAHTPHCPFSVGRLAAHLLFHLFQPATTVPRPLSLPNVVVALWRGELFHLFPPAQERVEV
uniref:Putative secreted protein n=1 Tax=Anopheles triannulatus TaxID=58253 RepID=A0A2M4B6W4_9DIPT